MDNTLFISHSSRDRKSVEILANLIRKVSLNQINIWFSSDNGVDGGFLPGDNWFETIHSNLKNSNVVISFITPNSNNQPWILYESGYAEALEKNKLIPIKFLINVEEISAPLQHKQIFGFSNINEANEVLRKVLNKFNIVFDDEAFSNYVIDSINEMRKCFENGSEEASGEDLIESLSKKLDNYFGTILKLVSSEKYSSQIEYEVSIEYENIAGKMITEYLKINPTVRVSDILDSIYYILNGKVRAYKYLESWIIKEKGTERYVVISDIQDLVLAIDIFKPNTRWEVEFLEKPYKPNNIYNSKNNDVRMESLIRYRTINLLK